MKDLKFTPETSFEKHFEKLRHGPFRSSLDHYIETGKLSGNALITVREMYKEFLETTDHINGQLEMALITRDGSLTNKLMHERITKLSEALKQAKEALDTACSFLRTDFVRDEYGDTPKNVVCQALETINKLGI